MGAIMWQVVQVEGSHLAGLSEPEAQSLADSCLFSEVQGGASPILPAGALQVCLVLIQ
jgi:hypothetical protein